MNWSIFTLFRMCQTSDLRYRSRYRSKWRKQKIKLEKFEENGIRMRCIIRYMRCNMHLLRNLNVLACAMQPSSALPFAHSALFVLCRREGAEQSKSKKKKKDDTWDIVRSMATCKKMGAKVASPLCRHRQSANAHTQSNTSAHTHIPPVCVHCTVMETLRRRHINGPANDVSIVIFIRYATFLTLSHSLSLAPSLVDVMIGLCLFTPACDVSAPFGLSSLPLAVIAIWWWVSNFYHFQLANGDSWATYLFVPR